MKRTASWLLLSALLLAGSTWAQYKPATPKGHHASVVSQLLQRNGQMAAAQKSTAGVPTQRVIAQSTTDNATSTYTDSVQLRYTGMRKSAFDYNYMLYAYNYPYSTTPMFEYAGIFTEPQVKYDTYIHWTINPFLMPAFQLYEGSFAVYNTNSCLTQFTELFVDSATNDNRRYRNTFNTANDIAKGYTFNLNAGVEDSAFIQYFAYDAGNRIKADSMYEIHLGVWRIVGKSYYTYDAGGNLTQIDHWANVSDTSFLQPLVQQSKYVNTYDAGNRLKSVYTSIHDGTSLSPYVKDTFDYTGSLPFHTAWRQHQFDEIHTTWWPQYRMTKHLAGSLPDTVYHDGWDSILNKWVPISKDAVTYNSDNNPDTMWNFLYNWTAYSASPDYTTVYHYETFSDTTPVSAPVVAIAGSGILQLFPNPATQTVAVAANWVAGHSYVATLWNMNGQMLVRQAADATHNTLPVASLPTGMYMVTLEDRQTGQRLQARLVKE